MARYDAGGNFDYHHDGYGRYLTVLYYLNGVGGTYFPFGDDDDRATMGVGGDGGALLAAATSKGFADEARGVLIVGKEGSDAYTAADFAPSPSVHRRDSRLVVNPKNIVRIGPGDAVAFYSYDIDGVRDMRTLHCSLTVPEEKWISTCWFRSEELTGPFASLKKARMMDAWITKGSLCTSPTNPFVCGEDSVEER